MQVLPAGRDALLVELVDATEASLLYADLIRHVPCRDVVPGSRTVLLDGLGGPGGLDAARSYLAAWVPTGVGERGGERSVELPTTYDGEDLDDVARRWDMTRAEVVATHTRTAFTVSFVGFSPGFAYCAGLPAELAVPRLDRPRPRVPAGAVGVAGEYTAAYPSASPGGWRLLGRTDAHLWDVDREEPALLTPGTRVRFVEV